MIRFVSSPAGPRESLNRRELLRLGWPCGLGLGLAASRASGAPGARTSGFGHARSVLLVYANGGQSQLETWDPKPEAPEGIRGEFGAIRTAVPGTLLCEHLPQLARLADRYTIVRTMAHEDLDHGSATYLALTGRYHTQRSSNPLPSPFDFPTYAALLKRVRPARQMPYTAVHVNGPALVPELPSPGQAGGFLTSEFDPLVLGDVSQGPALLSDLKPWPGVPAVRMQSRRSWLESVDAYCQRLESDRTLLEMNGLYRQAYELLASPRYRQAFDINREPPALRDRYGRHRSGQACLLARRLVEAGVPWITLFWNHSGRGQDTSPGQFERYGWDTHNDIFDVMRDHLLPWFDQSFSALLEDLDARGLLDQTLVICMGEFGRAPRVALETKFAGQTPGRKHWASVYSMVAAGAGVSRGAVVGGSDRIGGHPTSDPFGPWDVAATMYWSLGIDPATEYRDPLGRPFPITTGQPIRQLYSD